MGKLRVEYPLDAFTEIFDFVKEIITPSHRFASDISEVGRPISIGGSREFLHRVWDVVEAIMDANAEIEE